MTTMRDGYIAIDGTGSIVPGMSAAEFCAAVPAAELYHETGDHQSYAVNDVMVAGRNFGIDAVFRNGTLWYVVLMDQRLRTGGWEAVTAELTTQVKHENDAWLRKVLDDYTAFRWGSAKSAVDPHSTIPEIVFTYL